MRPIIAAMTMGAVGIGLACGGWFWQARLDEFVDRSTKVEGEVVAISPGRGPSAQYLRFRYPAGAGETRVARSSYPLSGYAVGDKIAVAYDPDHPADALLPEAVSSSFGPQVLMGFGAAFALIALYAGVSDRRRKIVHTA